jgi:hypothetical protein
MNRRAKLLALAGLVLSSSFAGADEIPSCPAPNGVESRSFPDQIPPPLMKALTERYGAFARSGEKFYATDAHLADEPPLSNRRIIFVWQQGARWLFATEHGGMGYNDPIFLYDLDDGSAEAALVKEEIGFPITVCEKARKLLSDKP